MKALITIGMLAIASCATPYKGNNLLGGYSSTRLSENEFIVRFSGNGFTSSERSTDFALLRCAEVAQENGFPFFSIIDSDENESYSIEGNSSSIRTITKPSNRTHIVCFGEKPSQIQSYESAYIIISIKDKYNLWGK
ncbi:hypothetical protein [Ekhidna sp.]|uniref:CC0125/CC1285 family lipoprotein n=1 Tax=Ekhidna sp. TaxID=2608089 RepID=UPI003518EB8D